MGRGQAKITAATGHQQTRSAESLLFGRPDSSDLADKQELLDKLAQENRTEQIIKGTTSFKFGNLVPDEGFLLKFPESLDDRAFEGLLDFIDERWFPVKEEGLWGGPTKDTLWLAAKPYQQQGAMAEFIHEIEQELEIRAELLEVTSVGQDGLVAQPWFSD